MMRHDECRLNLDRWVCWSDSYRGWSILLCALIAALLAGQLLLANRTQTFMSNAAGFVGQFFPIFLLGALFGKLMEASGLVEVIAKYLTERLGTKRAMLGFVLAPMGHALFKAANIWPRPSHSERRRLRRSIDALAVPVEHGCADRLL